MKKVFIRTICIVGTVFILVFVVPKALNYLAIMGLSGCHPFVTDRTAVYGDGLHWNGAKYIEISGRYSEGKTLALTTDGSWEINAVKEDNTHTFVVLRSFLDDYLYVREDYAIPTDGNITAVYWWGKSITDPLFCQAIGDIYAENGDAFEYETEGIFMLTDTQHMRDVYLAYEGCPIGTSYIGYLGKINDKWAMTVYISPDNTNANGSPKPYKVICKTVADKYDEILSKYFTNV